MTNDLKVESLPDPLTSPTKTKSEILPILALIATCFMVGLITVGDYGESWDEASIYRYADQAINAYGTFFQGNQQLISNSIMNVYGPSYFMGMDLFSRAITRIHAVWSGPISWHFGYFLTFLICILLLYLFLRRWFRPGPSLITCLLFVSQPLFWGHAFINPKDLPFMTFFLASIYLGFQMVDRYFSPRPNYLLIVFSAFMLGLTISFRLAGPLAGLLVSIYAITKSPRKSVVLLSLYLLLASITTYLSWPFLWGAPFSRFMESLGIMSQFPFPTKVLFMGHYYPGNHLPWLFYPVMLGIQLTEPTLLLAVAGLALAMWQYPRRKGNRREPLLLFIGWFLLPVIAIIALGSTLYDNGRQLFFLLPPLFLLVALSMEALINLFHSRWLIAGVALLFMIPGIYASIRLHPYEYIYYNSLVGGTGAAYKQYEMDYWGTSYREIYEWLNANAPVNSTIWVTGPSHLLQPGLRSDLRLSCTSDIDCGYHYDYVVSLARWKAETQCRGAVPVFTVSRSNAIFSVIKQLPPGKLCR